MKQPINKLEYDATHLVAIAVLPLRVEAVKRAKIEALKIIAEVTAELEQAGNDLNIAAPYPSTQALSDFKWHEAHNKYKLFSGLCEWRQSSYRMHEPHYADVSQERIAKFIRYAEEDAAAQYDSFIKKLITKIGNVKTAILRGDHVWSYSILNVELPDGTVQSWKTQQIVNVSKLGKLFNQWPSRKVLR